MGRLIDTSDLVKSLFDYENGKKTLGQCVDDTPTAQQWTPCSEQEYPSDNRDVEVTCEFTRYDGKKIRYTCHATYVHRYSIETTYDDWEDCEEYNEEKDTYYALPGWYERVHNWDDYSYCTIEDRVVAWRELLEPWRGES